MNHSIRETFKDMMRMAFPEAHVDRPTFGWVSKAFNTIVKSTTDDALRSVKIPILIGSAGIETLVDNGTLARAARLMPRATLINLPTAHHGLWFEDDKNYDLWIGNVRRFMHKLTGGAESADIPFAPQQFITAQGKTPPGFPVSPVQA